MPSHGFAVGHAAWKWWTGIHRQWEASARIIHTMRVATARGYNAEKGHTIGKADARATTCEGGRGCGLCQMFPCPSRGER